MAARILVVDDHPDILQLITLVLQSAAYEVITASRGDAAISQWEAAHPDLVILDLNLPGLPGWLVYHHLKAMGTTPVLIMSGQTATEHQARRLAPNAEGYLLKPFDIQTLNAQVADLLVEAPLRERAVG